MSVEKILQDEDFRSTISFRDRPGADEDDPTMSPFLARPERVQKHEISHVARHDRPHLDACEGEEFSIGSLIPIGTQIEDRDDVVSAFFEGLRYGGVQMRIKQEPHQVRTGRDTATS